jgi:hypothetical protein
LLEDKRFFNFITGKALWIEHKNPGKTQVNKHPYVNLESLQNYTVQEEKHLYYMNIFDMSLVPKCCFLWRKYLLRMFYFSYGKRLYIFFLYIIIFYTFVFIIQLFFNLITIHNLRSVHTCTRGDKYMYLKYNILQWNVLFLICP